MPARHLPRYAGFKLDLRRGDWQYYWHRFYPSQPDLNYDNPEVQQAMLDVMHFWLDKGSTASV